MSEILQSQFSVKLYEYELTKPELEPEFLEHHGILGMHWGQRNGPPYPLDDSVSTGKRLKGSGKISRHKKRKLQKKRVQALKKARQTRADNKQRQKTKEDILRRKDIVSMYENLDQFTNKEINDVLERLRVENSLREAVENHNRRNKSTGQKMLDVAKRGIGKGASQGAESILSDITKRGMRIAARKGLSKTIGQELTDQLLPGYNKKDKKNKNKNQNQNNDPFRRFDNEDKKKNNNPQKSYSLVSVNRYDNSQSDTQRKKKGGKKKKK